MQCGTCRSLLPPQVATGTSSQTARCSRQQSGHLYRLPSKLACLRHHRPAILVCCRNRLGCLERCSCNRLCILLAAGFRLRLRRDAKLPLPRLCQAVERGGFLGFLSLVCQRDRSVARPTNLIRNALRLPGHWPAESREVQLAALLSVRLRRRCAAIGANSIGGRAAAVLR